MKTFRLSSIFYAITVIALFIATISSWRKAETIRAQYERVSTEFGYIGDVSPKKTHIRRFIHRDYRILAANRSSSAESFRFRPAEGVQYVLHVSEFGAGDSTAAADLIPLETVRLDSWRPDAVLSCEVIRHQGLKPRVIVMADSKTVMDFQATDPWGNITATGENWPDVPMAAYQELEPDQRIRFYRWEATDHARGFVFWLEPEKDWKQRQSDHSEQPSLESRPSGSRHAE